MAVVLSVLDVQRHVARGTRAYRRGHGTPRRAAAAADPFPLPPPSLPRLHLLRHPCFAHSLPYSSFLLPLNLSRSSHRIAQRKITASCKSRIVPNTLGPHDLKSWRGRVPRVPKGGCACARKYCSESGGISTLCKLFTPVCGTRLASTVRLSAPTCWRSTHSRRRTSSTTSSTANQVTLDSYKYTHQRKLQTRIKLLSTRGVYGNGEDWDHMGPMGFPREWE